MIFLNLALICESFEFLHESQEAIRIVEWISVNFITNNQDEFKSVVNRINSDFDQKRKIQLLTLSDYEHIAIKYLERDHFCSNVLRLKEEILREYADLYPKPIGFQKPKNDPNTSS